MTASSPPDVVWHAGSVRRGGGATIWITGLPAAGKSTVACALEERLAGRGVLCYRLDGDNLRHGLNADMGFAPADRDENVRRTAEVARLFADAGLVAICALVSPYAAGRAHARAIHETAGLGFLEVFVNATLQECEHRDPKGLYARARRGELHAMTGVDAPYEPPASPDVELRSAEESVEQEVTRVVEALGALDAR